jgi:hypothetical protein
MARHGRRLNECVRNSGCDDADSVQRRRNRRMIYQSNGAHSAQRFNSLEGAVRYAETILKSPIVWAQRVTD